MIMYLNFHFHHAKLNTNCTLKSQESLSCVIWHENINERLQRNWCWGEETEWFDKDGGAGGQMWRGVQAE